MKQRPESCAACPAFPHSRAFVPFVGPADAPLLFIGQGPGETEAQLGVPFIGDSGRLLDKWCQLAGIDRQKARVGNVALCHLPENRAPRRVESRFCRDAHWAGETAGHRVIVPIGTPAMEHFYPRRPTAGHIDRLPDGTYVVGLLHPAYIMRGNWGVEGAQIQTLRRVKRILDGWEPPIYDFTQPPPGANLFPTLAELRAWEASLAPDEPIVVDVENAGWVIRLVGLCGVRSLRYIGVHFRQQGGHPWIHCEDCGGAADDCLGAGRLAKLHAVDRFEDVVEWLYDLLATRPLIMHNGFHDVEMLEEVGFEIGNFAADTILQMHCAFPEGRKRLEHVSMITSGITGWKSTLKEGGGHWK